MTETHALLLLPRLRVQNANAISGPLTWGFPAPSAFTGFAHALERRLRKLIDVKFGGVGIVCHQFDPQVSRPANRRHQVFCLTRNPLGRDGGSSALVEEGRAHLEISLVIEVLNWLDEDDRADLQEHLLNAAHSMRLAGGSILPLADKRHQPQWFDWPEAAAEHNQAFRKLRRRLLPGFALVQRDDLLTQHLQTLREADPTANSLDALLDLTRLNIEPAGPDPKNPDKHLWEVRRSPGWLVPLPVGYAALSPLYAPGEVSNARDETTPFRFVESLYTLGQWLGPHRLTELEQLLWRHQADTEAGLYRCNNQYAKTLNPA
jgi:CRISPR-associated protein Csy2